MSAISRETSTAPQIQEFPGELVVNIFRFLPLSGLISAGSVCRKWNNFSRDRSLHQFRLAAAHDVVWLRGVSSRSLGFSHVFNNIPSNIDPFIERSNLLRSLIPTDGITSFCIAAEQGNIHMGKAILPLIHENRNFIIPRAFTICADRAQTNFARWLISTLPDVVDVTGMTSLKVKIDIGYGNNLFLHGENLYRFFTSFFDKQRADPTMKFEGAWEKGLPMTYKEEIAEDGNKACWWETVLLWRKRPFHTVPFSDHVQTGYQIPELGVPFKPVIHTADGRFIWSKGNNYTMKVGTSVEITPEFEY